MVTELSMDGSVAVGEMVAGGGGSCPSRRGSASAAALKRSASLKAASAANLYWIACSRLVRGGGVERVAGGEAGFDLAPGKFHAPLLRMAASTSNVISR